MTITTEILNAAKRGNSQAQRVLYDAYKSELFQVCRRYSRDDATAKDMFQEGFIKILKDLHQYNPSRGALNNWIRKVMVNACLQNIRKNKRASQTQELNSVVTEDLSYMDHVISQMSMKEIYKLMKMMPDGYQLVFNLFLIEGYSHKEIADQLDFSVNTSKSQLFKAKQWMREKLIQLDPTLELKYGRKVSQG